MLRSLPRLSPRVWSAFAASDSCILGASQHAIRRYASTNAAGCQGEECDVVIALGTNMGNRGLNLHRGLRRLRQLGLSVLRHSALYETAAAYVTDQPAFLNAAVLARTRLPPRELLRMLKQVEAEAGRDLAGGPRFGPRPLDLDIVFYGGGGYRDERLEVPHPRWRERPFVTAPVADLLYRRDASAAAGGSSSSSSSSSSSAAARGSEGATPSGRGSSAPLPYGHAGSVLGHLRDVRGVWDGLCSGQLVPGPAGAGANSGGGGTGPRGGEIMRRVTPLLNMDAGPSSSSSSSSSTTGGSSSGAADALLTWGVRTQLMAILNVTPDSFSDGGKFFPAGLGANVGGTAAGGGSSAVGGGGSSTDAGLAAVVGAAEAMVREGADMLDVGGQSTRPGATRLTHGEELARVMPVVRALRQSPLLRSVPISVDTFYAQVARETVAAGANIVNDVSGGALDPDMRDTVAELGVPYVLMHMRGDPGTMSRPEHTSYGGPVWRGVGGELMAGAAAAEAAGVPAWSIILDPGIGFAKTAEGNVQLLRDLPLLRSQGLDGPYAASAAAAASGSSPGADGGSSSRLWGGPLLVGPSRKRFLGSLTGREVAAERDAATAAACVVAVAAGADVMRVHNVRDVRDALCVADAVYRG
ncbi:hypothetical protein HXX76_000760 [Chlamydomonas incerta]|uniref:Pterin-binding domain-containing protein n=1 Tax=Chlamydomonas incerta TaxID=51695 RepID=A0A836B2Y1_CHLIN|nr:hypothetical protein HXX76_000760 [Chlamydomonas incerta]|eukprot:KAG2446165.1 hypothetical protein HXX76_000760 [Chlamydomonas incerta]